jgi:PIN domain nuclease of toxin-antitoxin system
MHSTGVLLDTSFFIRLLNEEDILHENAKAYFKYFVENDIVMKFSTVSIAEFCVKDELESLPLRNIQILPFNLDHAKTAGLFTKAIYNQKAIKSTEIRPRAIIPNDSKLFAQAHLDKSVQYYITSDAESGKTITLLRNEIEVSFTFVEISKPVNEVFGMLF